MTKQQRTVIWLILAVLALGVLAYFVTSQKGIPTRYWLSDPTTYQECVEATGVILESYPEQCQFRGKSFTNPDQKLETTIPNSNLYTNTKLGISFNNQVGWPNPQQLPGGNIGDGGFRIKDQSLWKLNLGNLDPSLCEGEPCYVYSMEGFPVADPQTILTKLRADPLILLLSDENINGNRVLTYDEGGICGSLNALVFGKGATVAFQYSCGVGEDQTDFSSIIKSLRIN